MTIEEINKIPFRLQSHLSMENEHTSTYVGKLPNHYVGFCVHQPYKDGVPKGKTYTHYALDKEVYKSKTKWIEALKMLVVPQSTLNN